MSTPELLPPQTPALPITPATLPNTGFRGPNGLRAGWRALIFLAIVVVLFILLAIVLAVFVRGNVGLNLEQLRPLGLGLTEGTLFIIASSAALIMTRIEHRAWGTYGLPVRSAFQGDFWIGTVVGFVSISSCLSGIAAFHGFHLTGFAIHGSTIASAAAAWGATFIMVGLTEEFCFRGYLQYTLTTGMGFWPSAILLSALFGLAHGGNPGESWTGLLSVVLFGWLFCLFLRRRGNLWWAVGFHAGWDWGQTFFYGVPDSGIPAYHSLWSSSFSGPRWLTGGTVGPEASIFTPMALMVVAILFTRVYRENKYQA